MRIRTMVTASAALLLLVSRAEAQRAKPLGKCAPDAVVSGTVCMDRYEATVWRVPQPAGANKGLVKKIQQGKAKVKDLVAGGASQLGVMSDDYAPCADNGQNCANDIFAVSLPQAIPSAYVTWFQAQVACENSAKRLPTNVEWQGAVVGTPDPGPDDGVSDCNTVATFSVAPAGSRASCVSARGAFDMVGNLWEWVGDWVPRSAGCGDWNVGISPTDDEQCFGGAALTGEPGALLRGGSFVGLETQAGPFTINGGFGPSAAYVDIGFRCAR